MLSTNRHTNLPKKTTMLNTFQPSRLRYSYWRNFGPLARNVIHIYWLYTIKIERFSLQPTMANFHRFEWKMLHSQNGLTVKGTEYWGMNIEGCIVPEDFIEMEFRKKEVGHSSCFRALLQIQDLVNDNRLLIFQMASSIFGKQIRRSYTEIDLKELWVGRVAVPERGLKRSKDESG